MNTSKVTRIITVTSILFMAIALLALMSPLGTHGARAASGWEQQNPGIDWPWQYVSAVDAKTAWINGGGLVIRTIDGGATWEQHLAPNPSPTSVLGLITAVDAKTAWVAGGDGTIAKTTDGGGTWNTQFSYPGGVITGIAAADSNNVWAFGYYIISTEPTAPLPIYTYQNVLLKTDNGGSSWSIKYLFTHRFVFPWITSVYATDANIFWMIGIDPTLMTNDFAVLKTVDGGATWSAKPVPPEAWGGTGGIAVRGVDAETAWLADAQAVFKTTDGGNTWVRKYQYPAPCYSLPSIAAFGNDIAWIGLDGGRVIRTLDGGNTWSQQQVAIGANSRTVIISAADPNNAWATSANSVNPVPSAIFHTTDGGGQPVSMPPAVSAINPSSGTNTTTYAVEILGSNFQQGATVSLVQGATIISGTGVALSNPGRLTCYLDLTSKPLGKYDVVVTNPDGQEARLTKGFSVTDVCGQGAGATISVLAAALGLLSLAGSVRLRMRRRRNRMSHHPNG